MSINLIKHVQEKLGYPALHKVDPNLQDIAFDPTVPKENRLAQAAIPSVLLAFYKMLKTEEGTATVLREINSTEWATMIFGERKEEAVHNIASYASVTPETALYDINRVATLALNLLIQHSDSAEPVKSIMELMRSERENILLYLPAVLHMGDIVGDESLDDKTNKMEGPVSSLMHKIETSFSGSK